MVGVGKYGLLTGEHLSILLNWIAKKKKQRNTQIAFTEKPEHLTPTTHVLVAQKRARSYLCPAPSVQCYILQKHVQEEQQHVVLLFEKDLPVLHEVLANIFAVPAHWDAAPLCTVTVLKVEKLQGKAHLLSTQRQQTFPYDKKHEGSLQLLILS